MLPCRSVTVLALDDPVLARLICLDLVGMTILTIFPGPEFHRNDVVLPFLLVPCPVIAVHKAAFTNAEIGGYIDESHCQYDGNNSQDDPEWSPDMILHKASPKEVKRGYLYPLF